MICILWKARNKDCNIPRDQKLVRDSEKFEIVEFEMNGQILVSETVNAEGTNVFVWDKRYFYKEKIYKNIKLQWQKKLRTRRTWEGLKKKNVIFILKLWRGISTKYQDCPNHLHGFLRQQQTMKYNSMRHARESLHLEIFGTS